LDIEETALIAMAASRLALAHADTINPDFNEQTLLKALKEIKHV
jgi:hypothetical protein